METLRRTREGARNGSMISSLLIDRHLVGELTRRDLKSRYVGSTLGAAWAVLQPLFLILIFTVIFSALNRGGLVGANFAQRWHYSVYLCAGLLPWLAASEIITRAAAQFVEMANLIKKIPFRKAVLMWSIGLANGITFLIAAGLFFAFLALIGNFHVGGLLVYLGVCMLFLLMAVGLGAVAACLTVFIRDVKHVVGVGMQLWFWATPIVWVANENMPGWLLRAERFNPVYWFVEPMQGLIVYARFPTGGQWLLMVAAAAGSLWIAARVLRRVEPHMADAL